jgi:hypothetical protein
MQVFYFSDFNWNTIIILSEVNVCFWTLPFSQDLIRALLFLWNKNICET